MKVKKTEKNDIITLLQIKCFLYFFYIKKENEKYKCFWNKMYLKVRIIFFLYKYLNLNLRKKVGVSYLISV